MSRIVVGGAADVKLPLIAPSTHCTAAGLGNGRFEHHTNIMIIGLPFETQFRIILTSDHPHSLTHSFTQSGHQSDEHLLLVVYYDPFDGQQIQIYSRSNLYSTFDLLIWQNDSVLCTLGTINGGGQTIKPVDATSRGGQDGM